MQSKLTKQSLIMRLSSTLIYLCIFLLCNAQPYVNVRTFSIRDGLAANLISGMEQTPDGLMWFPTWNGLCCYDGYTFTTYRGNPHSLSSNRIISCKSDRQGHIWCITYDRKLYLFDTGQSRFVNISSILQSKYHQDAAPRNVYPLGNGHTWVTCNDGHRSFFRLADAHPAEPDSVRRYLIDGKQIRGTLIMKVMEDSDGHETIVTDKGMLLLHNGKWYDIEGEYMEQAGGSVYYASPQGKFARYDKQTRKLTLIPMPQGVTAIHCMIKAGDNLLMGTNRGIVTFSVPATSHHPSPLTPHLSPLTPIYNLYADSKGRVWAFADNGGVFLITPPSPVSRDFTAATPATVPNVLPPGSPSYTTSRSPLFVEDSHHSIWLIPRDGVFSYYDETAGSLVPYQLQSEGYTYANIPVINKFHIDQQHNVWVCGTHDLSLLNFRYRSFHHAKTTDNEETRALCATHDGRLWTGDGNGHVMLFTPHLSPLTSRLFNPKVTGYLNSQGNIVQQPVKMSNRVYAMLEDRRHRLWIGTKGDGLYLLEAPGRLRHFMPDPNNPYSISDSNVYALDQDRQGNIWVGTYGTGINKIAEQDGQIAFIHSGNDLKGYPAKGFQRIRRITHTAQGILILSTTDGLVTFVGGSAIPSSPLTPLPRRGGQSTLSLPLGEGWGRGTFYTSSHIPDNGSSLLTNDVLQTLVTKSGQVYVTTMGGGIQQLTSKTLLSDSLTFRTLDEFPTEEGNAWSLTEDRKGNIWVTREAAINCYNPATGAILQYGANDLNTKTEFTEALPAQDAAGQIYMATIGGYIAFQPGEIRKDQSKPRIIFTRVQYQGDATPKPLLRSKEITIESHQRSLTIHFAAIDYADKHLVQYAYRMHPDEEWTVIGSTPRITFSNLSPGRYTLQVKSTNSDGVWTDNANAIVLDVTPMLWERMGVKILALLLIIAGAVWSIQTYKKHRQTAQERERHLQNILRQYREANAQLAALTAASSTQHPDNPTPQTTDTPPSQLANTPTHPAPSSPVVPDGSGHPQPLDSLPPQPTNYRLEEPEVRNEDDEMMQTLMAFIEQHIGDENLKIEDMADAVNMSRTTFYERLKSLVGTSPSDFLRHLRMQRAQDLMALSTLNVSQVAYSVGFTDPKYFTRCFRKAVGMSPTEYREQHRQ